MSSAPRAGKLKIKVGNFKSKLFMGAASKSPVESSEPGIKRRLPGLAAPTKGVVSQLRTASRSGSFGGASY